MRFSRHLRQLDGLFDRPIAHRGLHNAGKGIVENSQGAFEAAIQHRYAIECDVQLTSDGEAIVFHDETLERLTHSQGYVAQKSVRELKSIALKSTQDRMQTLPELLDQISGQVPLVIEIKSLWDGKSGLTERVVDVIHAYKGQVAVMSFDPGIVTLLAHIATSHVRGIVAERAHDPYHKFMPISQRYSLRTFSHLEQSRPHFVSCDATGLPYAPVQSLRQSGMPVICWTIRSKEHASRALRYCDQITFEQFLPL